MRALASMAPPQTCADGLAGSLGAPSVPTCENSQALRRSRVKPPLLFFFSNGSFLFLQQVADRTLQDGSQRHLTVPSFPLQGRLQLAGQSPTIYLGFHALQCSAFCSSWQQAATA